MKLLFLFLLSLLLISTSVKYIESEDKKKIYLKVEGIKEIEGNIGILVFNKEDGFPESPEKQS